jgi:hypothetical protein
MHERAEKGVRLPVYGVTGSNSISRTKVLEDESPDGAMM